MANSFPVDLAHAVFKELKRHGTTDVDIDTLTDLFETLYFASLETEELQPITCSKSNRVQLWKRSIHYGPLLISISVR